MPPGHMTSKYNEVMAFPQHFQIGGKLFTPNDDYVQPETCNCPYRLLYYHIHNPLTSPDNKLPAVYKFPLCLVAWRYEDCFLGILSTRFNSFCDLDVNPVITDMEIVFAVPFVTHGIHEHGILPLTWKLTFDHVSAFQINDVENYQFQPLSVSKKERTLH